VAWYTHQVSWRLDIRHSSNVNICLRNTRDCNVGVTDKRNLRRMAFRWHHIACHDQFSWRLVQELKQYKGFVCLYNLRGYNAGIVDGWDLWSILLKCLNVAWYTYQEVAWRLVQAFKQYKSFATEIPESVMMVLLMGGIYEVHRCNDALYMPSFIKTDWGIHKI
jgi:hypothetical protein